ncbi:hypothetical protein E4J66_13700 [Actinomyces viscosus]|nr:hypothetical protein E4J66_13700 [Actinomyces viscosus]
MSMVLTSAPHRRCTSRKYCSISTILTGCFDGGIVDVSAVDTGLLAGLTPRGRGGGAGGPRPGAGLALPA